MPQSESKLLAIKKELSPVICVCVNLWNNSGNFLTVEFSAQDTWALPPTGQLQVCMAPSLQCLPDNFLQWRAQRTTLIWVGPQELHEVREVLPGAAGQVVKVKFTILQLLDSGQERPPAQTDQRTSAEGQQ